MLFPGDGVTKGDLFEYYAEIAPAIVPHLRDRPFTMKRWREGLDGRQLLPEAGAEGQAVVDPDAAVPDLAARGRLAARRLPARERAARRCVWMVQMHCIDMNAWYSRVDKPERPDYVVFDLDPPESRNGFTQAIRVAHLVREALERLELDSYVKTSGADGIHVLVPIARRSTYAETYEFAERVSRALEAEQPGPRDDGVAEEEAAWRARRPPPERARQDDRVRLLGAAEAGRARLDAAALGGARREGASA